ncbi:MAG TPA: 50S ribosomal protein L20 [Bdellovibrionota bacterium]|nr:50S ribosomal protein L20 [Bdellovibrionota bacterium]
MARVKRGPKARRRRKRVMNMAEGYYGRKKNCFTIATMAVDHALQYAYVGRRQRKRNFRALWIQRINAAARACGTTYSKLVPLLKKAEIEIDRKILANLAVTNPKAFAAIVEKAKAVEPVS